MDSLADKPLQLRELMQHVGSNLQQLLRELKDEQCFGEETEEKLEQKRAELQQIVNEVVDLVKKHIVERQKTKLSNLQQQVEQLQQEMKALQEAEATLMTALKELEAAVLVQDHKDLKHRLESVSRFPSLEVAMPTTLDFSMEEQKLNSLIELNNNFLKEINFSPPPTEVLVKHLDITDLAPSCLKRLYGRTSTLDPNTAHPEILISNDLMVATWIGSIQPYPEHQDRSDHYLQVMAMESFSSGRHYWELEVSQARRCWIGIASNVMARKGNGRESRLGLNPESWCIEKWIDKYTALHDSNETPLDVTRNPKRLGLCLDCDAGELACYGDSQLLHTFKGNFDGSFKPALGFYKPAPRSIFHKTLKTASASITASAQSMENLSQSVQFCSL
uniref:tripartite motif-containing protein 14-like isoform X2 n=1 Tax=Myxine glutinosa TaxID=7769 RepID=UPI00358F9FC6